MENDLFQESKTIPVYFVVSLQLVVNNVIYTHEQLYFVDTNKSTHDQAL